MDEPKEITAEWLGQYGPPEVQAEMERGVIKLIRSGLSESEAKKIVGADAVKKYGGKTVGKVERSGILDRIAEMIRSKLKSSPDDVLEGSVMLKEAPEEDYSGRADPGLGLEDFSPAGDVKAGLEAMSEGDLANLALATASLLLPGTIRAVGDKTPPVLKIVVKAKKRVVEPPKSLGDDAVKVDLRSKK